MSRHRVTNGNGNRNSNGRSVSSMVSRNRNSNGKPGFPKIKGGNRPTKRG